MGSENSSTVPEIRPIPGYEGYYAHSDGMILSAVAERRGAAPKGALLIMRPGSDKRARPSRLMVGLQVGSRRKTFILARLILLAFRGPCPAGMECSHKNGDEGDNRAANLLYETHAENCARKARHGTNQAGEKNAAAKLTAEDVVAMRRRFGRAGRGSGKRAADAYGLSVTHACRILNGEAWSHV